MENKNYYLMEKHRKNFKQTYQVGIDEIVLCEKCGKPADQIHHIIFRSEKPNHEFLDHPINLLALCGDCHKYYHDHKHTARAELIKERKLDYIFDLDNLQ